MGVVLLPALHQEELGLHSYFSEKKSTNILHAAAIGKKIMSLDV